MFYRRKRPPLLQAARMGFRSRLVLEKLGFDLRKHYEELLSEELPHEWVRLSQLLETSIHTPPCDGARTQLARQHRSHRSIRPEVLDACDAYQLGKFGANSIDASFDGPHCHSANRRGLFVRDTLDADQHKRLALISREPLKGSLTPLKVWSAVAARTGVTGITRRTRERHASRLEKPCASCGRCWIGSKASRKALETR